MSKASGVFSVPQGPQRVANDCLRQLQLHQQEMVTNVPEKEIYRGLCGRRRGGKDRTRRAHNGARKVSRAFVAFGVLWVSDAAAKGLPSASSIQSF